VTQESLASCHDGRIKKFALLAPAVAQMFSPLTLERIDTPFLVIAGSADKIAPLKTNTTFLIRHLRTAKVEIIPKADH